MSQACHQVNLPELLGALSLATDLANDQPFEAGLRTTLLALRLAERAGATRAQRSDVLYAGLLRFVGCTAYSHEAAQLFGDDNAMHRTLARIDPLAPGELSSAIAELTRPGRALDPAELLGAAGLAGLATASCEAALRFADRIGVTPDVRDALAHTYARWDGFGRLAGCAGESISWVARVIQVARVAELHGRASGVAEAIAVLRRRAGGQLDPELAELAITSANELCAELDRRSIWDDFLEESRACAGMPHSGLDEVARAFADFVDLKSVYTIGHSAAVASLAEAAAERLGMPESERALVRHAGLLHDLGCVSVPTEIWEKPGALNAAEWERVRLHPYYTERVLVRSPLLAAIAPVAAAHHERLDASGYPRSVPGQLIPRAGRLVAAADFYQALIEPRPHRASRAPDDAIRALEAEAKERRLDGWAVHAVLDVVGRRRARGRAGTAWPADLTDREVDVLRWLARGKSNKEIAVTLSISPKTVQHHVQHIYEKIGASTRAGAALFASEHALLPE